jgi:hypothetical protein
LKLGSATEYWNSNFIWYLHYICFILFKESTQSRIKNKQTVITSWMCYYLLLFWLCIIMSTSLQFVAFKQACFSLNCNICYMYVYLQDLYFLLNYYRTGTILEKDAYFSSLMDRHTSLLIFCKIIKYTLYYHLSPVVEFSHGAFFC